MAPNSQQLAQRRERESALRQQRIAAKVARRLRTVGIDSPRDGGGDGLLSEPVLLIARKAIRLHGEQADVYSPHGTRVGLVNKVWEANDWGLELCQVDGTPVFLISGGVVRGPDGSQIGTIGRQRRGGRLRGQTVHPLTAGERPVGCLVPCRFDHQDGLALEGDEERARILTPLASSWGVVELSPSTTDALRTMLIAACLDRLAERWRNSGGA